jgi:DMSO/TMAO reductase YedYZ heme-binding membrane subunit
MKDPRFAKFALLVNGLVPGAMLMWDNYWHQLGANPVDRAIHVTGLTALTFLVLTLAVTPVRKISGWNWLSHFRRMLGLFAFFYALAHFSIYFCLERQLSVSAVVLDVIQNNFILFGMIALLLMVPLAITSTNASIKRLGAARWKRLHELVYISVICAGMHYAMFGKLVGWQALIDGYHLKQTAFIAIIAILLLYRLVRKTAATAGH